MRMQEAGGGDAEAANARLSVMKRIALLEASDEAANLTDRLLDSGVIPRKAADDAAHIAIAVTSGVDYLVTWNCRHIANAEIRSQIEKVCRAAGYEPTIICTTDELLEPDYES